MEIDAKRVAELRRRTGLPMMKCKGALQEANGDLDAAEENLRKMGLKTVEKLKGRAMKDGLVFVRVVGHTGAAAVAVLCETDFVARSEDFTAFGEDLVGRVYETAKDDAGGGETLEGLDLGGGRTVKDAKNDLIAKIGENIALGDFARLRTESGIVSNYVHHNGKIATLVELEGEGLGDSEEAKALGRDLCMHVAFHAEVQVLDRDELDDAWLEKEREIFLAQAEDMPESKRDAITKGKLEKRLKEVVLLDQPFIKDEKQSVRQVVAALGKRIGKPVSLKRFARIAAGS